MTPKAGWIGERAAPAKPAAKAQASLEYRTTLSAPGTASANAVIERLDGERCRLRSVVMFDLHARLEFEVRIPGREPATVSGRVVDRRRNGARFVYELELAPGCAPAGAAPPSSASRLRPLSTLEGLPEAHGLMRARPRADAPFLLQYRSAREGFRNARAGNVSTGGLLMTSSDVLVAGMVLELQFVFPAGVLGAYPEETTVVDLRNVFKRKRVPSKLRRPFAEIVVQARVERYEPLGEGEYRYGLSFLSMSRETRQEIARYVDAVRHANKRHSSRR